MKKIPELGTVLFIALIALTACTARRTDRFTTECGKPEIAVLGVFHFDDPGLDVVEQRHHKEILSDEGQQELEALLDRLEQFRPTKILVEADVKDDSLLQVRYESYLKRELKADANEIVQIGFRLAERLGQTKVWAVDSPMWFAEEKDSLLFDDDYRRKFPMSLHHDYEPLYEEMDSLKTALPLVEYLHYMNRPDIRLAMHEVYLTNYAPVGAADNYVGADVVSNWYRRNLRIYANTCRVAETQETDGCRLLLVIGAGHSYLLNRFFQDSPDFEVAEITEIL